MAEVPAGPEDGDTRRGVASSGTVAVAPNSQETKQESAEKPAPQVATAKPTPAKPRHKPRRQHRVRRAVSLDDATNQFKTFAKSWMAKIGRSLKNGPERMNVRQEGGTWIARFTTVEPDTMEMNVKPSTSKVAPYVGVLRYQEHYFEARGQNSEAVRQGPYECVRRVRVTEIFRYDTGHWVN